MLIDIIKPESRKIVDGIPYVYNSVKSKWLSEQEFHIFFRTVHRNIKGNRFINFDGEPSNVLGFIFPRNANLKTIIVQNDNIVTCQFKIYKNQSIEILSINLNSQNSIEDNMLDIDLNKGDELSCKFISTESLKNINIDFLYSYIST